MRKFNNSLTEGVFLSAATGIFTGGIIFLFKLASGRITVLSENIYSYFRRTPQYIPFLILGLILLSILCCFFLKSEPDCKGGGIPTSLVFIRGHFLMKPLKNMLFVFFSALTSFLAGMPLGNEGPSVQMGCAAGNTTTHLTKNRGWSRYIMTGGACAGFASATGAPLSGILFAFEEAHRRFSPVIFITASASVITSAATTKILCDIFGIESALFSFPPFSSLPFNLLWTALIIGAIAGVAAILYTKLFKIADRLFANGFNRIPLILRLIIIFCFVGVLGIISPYFIGSGHSLIDALLHGELISPVILILCFIIRAIVLVSANLTGVTGGLFLPTLTFGAVTGAVCGDILLNSGLISSEHRSVMILLGIVSFLAATSRIPLTAIAFSMEVLSGIYNILPVTLAVFTSYFVIEISKTPSFNDTVIASKLSTLLRGKDSKVISSRMTVEDGSFIIGKEIRDILWPPHTVILSVDKKIPEEATVSAGDVLHIRYKTYNEKETLADIMSLIGSDKQNGKREDHKNDPNYEIPEI